MNYQCPDCHSHEIRKLSAIYEEHSSSIEGQITNRFSRSHQQRFSAQTATHLARKVAPHTLKKSRVIVILLLGIIGVQGSFLFGILFKSELVFKCLFWITLIAAAYGIYRDITQTIHSQRQYPKRLQKWHHSYRCYRCGCIFQQFPPKHG